MSPLIGLLPGKCYGFGNRIQAALEEAVPVEKNESKEISAKSESQAMKESKKRQTMHDNIGFWCDCCCCEAEPQWQEAAEKLGIDLSDREE